MMHPILKEDFDKILSRVTPRFKDMAGSHLLITGAAGFVGSYLMDFLVYANKEYFDRPVHVIGVDNWVAASRQPSLGPTVSFTSRIVDYRADWFIHLASIASPKLYLVKPLETLEANVNLTRRILEWSTQSHGVLHVSTSEVYGDTENVPTPETEWGHAAFSNNRAVYHESKRYAELLCQVYQQRFNVPVKIARPFYFYGPGESLNNGRVIPQLMKAALTKGEFTVYGDGWATRSLCYISDGVEQLLGILLDGRAGEAFNVGNDEEINMIGLASLGRELFGTTTIMVRNHELLVDAPNRRQPDLTKVMAIAPRPVIGLREGLERTFLYYNNAN